MDHDAGRVEHAQQRRPLGVRDSRRNRGGQAHPRLRLDVFGPVRHALAQSLEHVAQRAQHCGPAVGGDERLQLGPLQRLVDGGQQPARIDGGGRGHGQEHT